MPVPGQRKRTPAQMVPPFNDLPDDSGIDREDSRPVLIDPPGDDQDDDPWASLWGDATDRENATVQLIRKSPESMIDQDTGETVNLAGYVADLPPNLDSYEAYISAHYGGGRYEAVKRVKGRFFKKLTVEIAGAPKPPTSIQRGGAPATPVKIEPAVPGGESHDGISIAGSDREFEKRLERMKIIERMFPPPPQPPDLNAVLLQYVLNQQGGGGIGNLKETIQAVVLLKEIAGGEPAAGGGDDWMGLIRSGIEAFRAAVNSSRPAGQISGRRLAPAPRPAGLLPEKPQAAGPDNPQTIGESETMTGPTAADMIGTAIGVICQSFLLVPRLTPEETAQAIADRIPLPAEGRAALRPYKARLLTQARLALADDLRDDPEIAPEFPVFFDQVFDLFTGADWTPEAPIG